NDRRFWQWNRYTPVPECNAAMRDGKWKLVRPAIGALMKVSDEDFAMDVDAKFQPEKDTAIIDAPEPERAPATARPSKLFDIAADPGEQHDLAAAHPERVARMERDLLAWFEDVERDRLASKNATELTE